MEVRPSSWRSTPSPAWWPGSHSLARRSDSRELWTSWTLESMQSQECQYPGGPGGGVGRLVGLAAAGMAHSGALWWLSRYAREQSTLLTGRCSNQSLHRGPVCCLSNLCDLVRTATTAGGDHEQQSKTTVDNKQEWRGSLRWQSSSYRQKCMPRMIFHISKGGNEVQRHLVWNPSPS